jgi:hypothetical protein
MTDNIGFAPQALSQRRKVANGSAGMSEASTHKAGPQSPRAIFRETGGQFTLSQNHPNPFAGETTVPFTLANTADIRLSVFDMLGRKVASVVRKKLAPGEHTIPLNLYGLGLPVGDYSYQLQVTTPYGVFRQSKMMTSV